jgi:threonylcarbamoyladenosine tRNA methylthiotransferase MtaB
MATESAVLAMAGVRRAGSRPLRVVFHTVGCRANQADTAWLARQLDPAAVAVVRPGDAVDLSVVISCAVTRQAERDVARLVRTARRHGEVVLTGCLVSANGRAVAELGPMLATFSSQERDRLVSFLHALAGAGGAGTTFGRVPEPLRRTRPLLSIQDGCSERCAYCAVPAGRGPSRSLAWSEVRERLELLAAEGAAEIVICGVNLGLWGRDLRASARLAHLVAALDASAPVCRLRLSSLEPWTVDDELVSLLGRAERLAPHVHLPIQSGDDGVLARMGRPYRARDLVHLADALLAARPAMALGVDVIAGFPGEDEAAFRRTLELVERLPIAALHAFGFSPRPGTAAAAMDDQVPRTVVRARVAALRAAGEAKRRAYASTFVGKVLHAALEARPGRDGLFRGVTESSLWVRVPMRPPRPALVPVRAEALLPDGSLSAVPA